MARRRVFMWLAPIVVLPLLWCIAAAIATIVRRASAERYAEQVAELAGKAERAAEELAGTPSLDPLGDRCRDAAGGVLLYYWAGATPEVEAALTQAHPSGLRSGVLFGADAEGRLESVQHPSRGAGSFFDAWTTFLSELPTEWPRWADAGRSRPRLEDVDHLAVGVVRRLSPPRVETGGVVLLDAPAELAIATLDPATGERRCAGTLVVEPPEHVRIEMTGRGLTEESARADAQRRLEDRASQLERYWSAYLGRLQYAGIAELCSLSTAPHVCNHARSRPGG